MTKYFELNDMKLNYDLQKTVKVDLQNKKQYQMDYGIFTLTCLYNKEKRFNIEIPGIICGGLCFMLPIMLSNLPMDRPRANLFNSSQLMYNADQEFRKKYDELLIKSLYEVQQHIQLMNMLDDIPPEFYKLPYHLWETFPQLIDSLADSDRESLCHQHFIYCGENTVKDIHKHVNAIPNLSKIKLNYLTHYATCCKDILTKSPACHHSLCYSLTTTYQGLYVDFDFPSHISKDKYGNIINLVG